MNGSPQQAAPTASQLDEAQSAVPATAQSIWTDVKLTGESITNLVLVPLTFVLPFLWSYVHTNWPVGVFGIAVAVSALFITLARTVYPGGLFDRLNRRIFDLLIENKKAKWFAFAVLAIQLGLYFFVLGYVQVEYAGEAGGKATVWIIKAADLGEQQDYRQAIRNAEPHQISSGQPLRKIYCVLPFSGMDVIVKPKGYPDRLESIRSFGISKLNFPGHFQQRPVVLLRPTVAQMEIANDNELKAQIWVNDGPESEVNFSGNAIWIGCDEDVQVPEEVAQAIEAELQYAFEGSTDPKQFQQWLTLWKQPSAPAGRLVLQDEDVLHVRTVLPDGETYFEYEFVVQNNMVGNTDLAISVFGYAEY